MGNPNHIRAWSPTAAAIPLLMTLFAGACATATPVELTNARRAYARAKAGPAAKLAPLDLDKAKIALDHAERAFVQESDASKTVDLAYIAARTAQIAEAHAETAIAEKKTTQAREELGDKRREQAKEAQGELTETRQQLAQAERGLAEQTQLADSDRTARVEADKKAAVSEQKADASEQRAEASERKAQVATSILAQLAAKEDERGTIITLSGSVLFLSNDAALLPTALARLDQVAEALLANGREVVVEGHTDSRGSKTKNLDLSRRRAESVRTYLVSKGYPNEQITARGLGPERPIAKNSNAEGRANNRRVEIVMANLRLGKNQP